MHIFAYAAYKHCIVYSAYTVHIFWHKLHISQCMHILAYMCILSIYGYNVCLFAVFDDSEDYELDSGGMARLSFERTPVAAAAAIGSRLTRMAGSAKPLRRRVRSATPTASSVSTSDAVPAPLPPPASEGPAARRHRRHARAGPSLLRRRPALKTAAGHAHASGARPCARRHFLLQEILALPE